MPVTVWKYDSKVVAMSLITLELDVGLCHLSVTCPEDRAWLSRGVIRAPQHGPASDSVLVRASTQLYLGCSKHSPPLCLSWCQDTISILFIIFCNTETEASFLLEADLTLCPCLPCGSSSCGDVGRAAVQPGDMSTARGTAGGAPSSAVMY